MSWWCISSDSLQEMLYRVAGGEDPDLIYIEYYANTERQEVEDGQGEEESA